MGATTIYRLAEQAYNLIEGGDPGLASSISINEIKIACGNVINSLLKPEYFSVNGKMGETIPNGTVLGLYEDIEVVSWNGKSKATLPVKPIKLPRNMGIYAIYPKYSNDGFYELDKEFIPLQMGQAALLKSQPLISTLIGQIGYENFGMELIFTKDIKQLYPEIKLAMRLAIMDISLYGDFDVLPILPEMELEVIRQVFALYIQQPTADKVVDSTQKEEKGIPVNQQKQNQ
jgi:hypothetical protein